MPNKDYSEFSKIKGELDKMKENEMRHIRVAPGRQGMVTVMKKLTREPLADLEKPVKRVAKIVPGSAGIRGIAPARYD